MHEPPITITAEPVPAEPSEPRRPSSRTWRRAVRRWSWRLLAVVGLAGLLVGITYRHQIYSYVVHRKGGPSVTWPLTPFTEDQLLHVAVAGDTGDSGKRLDRTANAIATWGTTDPYDVLLLLGDNVYPNGDPARLPATVFTPFAATLAAGTDLLAVLGNHDVAGGHGPAQMAALGMEGRWWQRTYGDVLLIGLDSNTPEDPEQRAWLEGVLANTTAKWRIVALHHPLYSAGYQGSNSAARAAFQSLFEQYGVQLVLSGHDHDYQRSTIINGVTYVVSGAGSGTRRTGEASFTAASYSFHHFLDLNVFPDRIVVRAVGQDLMVADEFTILPGAPGG